MWLLCIVLLAAVPGLERVTVLEKFDTFEECQIERDRIGFEMAQAYPYERDFVIVCKQREIPTPELELPLQSLNEKQL